MLLAKIRRRGTSLTGSRRETQTRRLYDVWKIKCYRRTEEVCAPGMLL